MTEQVVLPRETGILSLQKHIDQGLCLLKQAQYKQVYLHFANYRGDSNYRTDHGIWDDWPG